LSLSDRRLLKHLLPATVCVGALLALGLAPNFACWLSGYGFACTIQGDMPYYLQLAAQPYYSHALYLSDPMVQGGVSFYPWLQYIPFVWLTRGLGLSIFWIQILWIIAAALGTGLTLYLFLWLVFRNRWLAAGTAICIWADIDFGVPQFAARFLFVHQVYLIASDFVAHLRGQPLLARPVCVWQWRLTNPALDLPFIFLQLVLTSIAREYSSRRNLALSGLVFALTFYVYFYLWTMLAAGLCLAILVDRPGRRTYAWTLVLGFALGWPQIVHDYLAKNVLSAEGLEHFGLFAPINQHSIPLSAHPYLVISELAIFGLWVTRRKIPPLILAWCMTCAGVSLYLVGFINGIYLHNYHWTWLAVSVMHTIAIAVALDLVMLWKSKPNIPGWVYVLLVSAYLAGGIYLTGSISLIGSRKDITSYSEYSRQRLVPGVIPLRPGSVIAGDAAFVDLAAAAEQQRPLAGSFLEVDMVVGDEDRRTRFVLDQYLDGTNRDRFAVLLNDYGPRVIPREQLPVYLHRFDEVSRDPQKFIDDLRVRYLALPAAQPAPTFLGRGWDLVQPGPYWQIWERIG
jgi:hypothetical protein